MEEIINIQTDRLATGDYYRDDIAIKRLRELFYERRKNNPRIISFNEAKELNLTKQEGRYKDESMSVLESYGFAWLENAHSLDYPDLEDTNKNWMEWITDHIANMVFHQVKIQWLVNIIKNEGLYSVPQGVIRAPIWNVHPGQFRVHAIDYTDCNEDFIVWDIKNRFPKKPVLDWEDFWINYSHHDDKGIFACVKKDNIEIHVGEDRNDMYSKVIESKNCLRGQMVTLDGTCDERLEHIFNHGTYEGHGVGIVGHFAFEDLQHISDFHPSKQIIEKENFTLYNNYHK